MGLQPKAPVFCLLRFMFLALLVTVIGLAVLPDQTQAADAQRDYTVAIFETGLPFNSVGADGEPRGFDIDLWNEIARRLEIKHHFQEMQHFPDVLEAVSRGEADFGLASLTMTSARAQSVVFSYPYYVSGQGILVNTRSGHTVMALAEVLCSPVILSAIALLVILTVIYGHLLWLAERGKDSFVSNSYIPGVLESMWCVFAIKTTIGFGDMVPRKWLARAIAVPIWFTGLFLVAVISAQLITEFVAERVKAGSTIMNHHDLRKKKVIVLEGSTGYTIVKQLSPRKIVQVSNPEKGYTKLINQEADALVFDYPYLASAVDTMRDHGYKVKITGEPFGQEFYGIAMSPQLIERDPALASKINLTILELRDQGYLEALKEKWIESLDTGE